MYKKCAQTVDNQREKPVQSCPQLPPYSTTKRAIVRVSRTNPQFMLNLITTKPHVLHSPVDENNRGENRVFLHLHTTYYYYY